MKFMLISPKNRTVYNFRGELIKDIINKGYEVIVTGPNLENVEKIQNLGAKFIRVELDKESTGLFSNWKYYKSLVKIMKDEKPDIVLAYTIKPVIFGTLAAKKAKINNSYSLITGLGQVYSFDANLKTKIIRFICGIAYKIIFKYNKRVIFQNKDDLEECVNRKYVKQEKCIVVDGSGVNLDKFSRTPLPNKNVFLMISRMIKTKGTIEYFKAAENVKKKYKDVEFLYLGKPENKNGYVKKEEIESFIQSNIVKILNETDNVPEVISKSSVVVLPSYYREGIPRTLLEALAMGRPIITTNILGGKQGEKDGKNGFLVPIKDVNALAEKMIYMIEHRVELERMSDESYKYCKERFDVNIINKRMLEIMEIE